ncbi:hypothetical protein G6F57_017243 [Rhizopus arrhizus]|uniref:Uncharacterized protein n=1 Tax=Rhizopus delemar TaxID=936053 RepID=A0A9P6Y3K3_9FUNG|nr:hypothetical protein G6F57_017243 [Rhizopus arrhizus]KAG1538398.1 hypothetical protein G6F50_014677 [Rhizopus delemar]
MSTPWRSEDCSDPRSKALGTSPLATSLARSFKHWLRKPWMLAQEPHEPRTLQLSWPRRGGRGTRRRCHLEAQGSVSIRRHWHPVFASLETLTFPSSENDEVDNGDPREHCRNPSDLPIFTGPASIAHGVGRTSHRPSQRGGPPGL